MMGELSCETAATFHVSLALPNLGENQLAGSTSSNDLPRIQSSDGSAIVQVGCNAQIDDELQKCMCIKIFLSRSCDLFAPAGWTTTRHQRAVVADIVDAMKNSFFPIEMKRALLSQMEETASNTPLGAPSKRR